MVFRYQAGAQGTSRSLGKKLEEFPGGTQMAQDAEAGMSVLIAIGFDEAPVMVAAYDVGLQARHDSYIQLVCVVVKGNRNRLWCGFEPL